jgi:hypothetical protein
VRPDLSLSAGYRLLMEYQRTTEEDRTTQKLTSGREETRGFEQTTTPLLLRSQGARLGVSLYF